MAFVSVPYRLRSRRNLDRSDLEALYAAIVSKLGGTYYVNGVAIGPVTGALDWRNFDGRAGIQNSLKANQYSLTNLLVFGSEIFLPLGVQRILVPADLDGTIISASIVYLGANNIVQHFLAQWQTVRSGVTTNFGAAIDFVPPAQHPTAAQCTMSNQTGLSVPISGGDYVQLNVTANPVSTIQTVAALVTIKTLHTAK